MISATDAAPSSHACRAEPPRSRSTTWFTVCTVFAMMYPASTVASASDQISASSSPKPRPSWKAPTSCRKCSCSGNWTTWANPRGSARHQTPIARSSRPISAVIVTMYIRAEVLMGVMLCRRYAAPKCDETRDSPRFGVLEPGVPRRRGEERLEVVAPLRGCCLVGLDAGVLPAVEQQRSRLALRHLGQRLNATKHDEVVASVVYRRDCAVDVGQRAVDDRRAQRRRVPVDFGELVGLLGAEPRRH